ELVAVVVARARRIDDVAGQDRERGALTGLQHAGHHRVLGGVALAGVAQEQEVEAVADPGGDPEAGVRAARVQGRHPLLAYLSGRVAEQTGEDLVPGLPEGDRVQPGEALPMRPEPVERADLPADPSGALLGHPRRRLLPAFSR